MDFNIGALLVTETVVNNEVKPTGCLYSDRLFSWDPDKHDRLCQKHFANKGQNWKYRSPKHIELFLRDYTGDANLILCTINQEGNSSTGYPVWAFRIHTKPLEGFLS